MKRFLKPALWVALGVLIAFPLFSMTYYAMVRTSTPHFCALCHEIQPAYQEWKTSVHAHNESGVVADCMDCHLPAPQDTLNFFYKKTYHGLKDVFAHFWGGEYDRLENRELAYKDIKNQQCQKCHRDILYMPYNRGAMLAHRSVIYARPGQEKRCVECHRNLVHVPKEQFAL